MSKKQETVFIQSIHRCLPENLHWEKMNNPYSSGTADVWYSGNVSDLWLEFKYLNPVPKKVNIIPEKLLTPLQWRWLNERYAEGRNVGVCIGCKVGGIILRNTSWKHEIPPVEFHERLVSRKDIANLITRITMTKSFSG